MQRNRSGLVMIASLLGLLIGTSLLSVGQETKVVAALPDGNKIYVDAVLGKNSNNGAQESPIQTLSEAAKRTNTAKGQGAITVYLSKGLYTLAEIADFNPKEWEFT